MARLVTSGAEGGAPEMDGLTVSGTVRVRSVGPVRSGRFAYDFGGQPSYAQALLASPASVAGDRRFFRLWVYVPALPSAGTTAHLFSAMAGSAVSLLQLHLLPSGVVAASTGGSDPTATAMTPAAWNLLEVSLEKLAAGAAPANGTRFQYRVSGGALITKDSSLTGNVDRFRVGNQGGTTINGLRADDIAVNDATGASENSWPSATAGVTCLLPVANFAAPAAWEGPTGAAITNHWDRLNETPPKAVANGSANVNSPQVRNDTSNAADTGLELTLQSPAEAGVLAGAVVKLAQGVSMIGTAGATNQSAANALTNGVVTADDTSVTTGTIAAGAFPTNWKRAITPLAVGADILPRATRPRMRTAKRTATTTALLASFMGAMIEADPAPAKVPVRRRRVLVVGG